ncbi:MAG TPA: hypothetical protein VFI42_13285 [Thermomicrobiaceae bacterium]|nr:hypothetical protein [Thermomicrobiaceae bacterium]
MSESTTFEPGKYITKVGNGDYLEVKWRLVWFRSEHPDGVIETEMVSHDGNLAVFRALVRVPNGGSATGWGSESADDFRDYLEKAETKALGRALAALGYGTQFTPDFEFGASESRVVDSPIDISRTRAVRGGLETAPAAATPKQIKFLYAIAREAGLSDEDLNTESQELYGKPVDALPRRDASALIERLQQRRAQAS